MFGEIEGGGKGQKEKIGKGKGKEMGKAKPKSRIIVLDQKSYLNPPSLLLLKETLSNEMLSCYRI